MKKRIRQACYLYNFESKYNNKQNPWGVTVQLFYISLLVVCEEEDELIEFLSELDNEKKVTTQKRCNSEIDETEIFSKKTAFWFEFWFERWKFGK